MTNKILRTLAFLCTLSAAIALRGAADDAQIFETGSNGNSKMFIGYLADSKTGAPKAWEMEDRGGKAIVDGDIVVGSVSDMAKAGNVNASKSLRYLLSRLWPKGIVPYVLAPNFPNRSVVLAAMQEISSKTPIKFVEHSNESVYIEFDLTDEPLIGGQSLLGCHPGGQTLELNSDTHKWNKGVVVHELCHALCIAHEQCRADRDKYIKINFDHIWPGYQSQFVQLFSAGSDQGDYDYDSIMHYPRNAFSKDGTDTIQPLTPNVKIGQRSGLSQKDAAGITAIYASETAKQK